MLIRISLIVAIIAGLAVAGLNFVMVKEKITTLQKNYADEQAAHTSTRGELSKTQGELKETSAKLQETEATLLTTTDERDKAVAEARSQTARAEALATELTSTRAARDSAQEELASYKATGLNPQQIVAVNRQMKTLQETLAGTQSENRVLGQRLRRLQNELDRYVSPEKPVVLPASLRGKILVADPKWNFVVVNIGEDQGVLEHGELLVNRDGKLVGKLVVRTVQKDRSIANLVPGWQMGDIVEGDQVIPAHPAS
jgi:hypothetical protein